jgi:hypothetical protein
MFGLFYPLLGLFYPLLGLFYPLSGLARRTQVQGVARFIDDKLRIIMLNMRAPELRINMLNFTNTHPRGAH